METAHEPHVSSSTNLFSGRRRKQVENMRLSLHYDLQNFESFTEPFRGRLSTVEGQSNVDNEKDNKIIKSDNSKKELRNNCEEKVEIELAEVSLKENVEPSLLENKSQVVSDDHTRLLRIQFYFENRFTRLFYVSLGFQIYFAVLGCIILFVDDLPSSGVILLSILIGIYVLYCITCLETGILFRKLVTSFVFIYLSGLNIMYLIGSLIESTSSAANLRSVYIYIWFQVIMFFDLYPFLSRKIKVSVMLLYVLNIVRMYLLEVVFELVVSKSYHTCFYFKIVSSCFDSNRLRWSSQWAMNLFVSNQIGVILYSLWNRVDPVFVIVGVPLKIKNDKNAVDVNSEMSSLGENASSCSVCLGNCYDSSTSLFTDAQGSLREGSLLTPSSFQSSFHLNFPSTIDSNENLKLNYLKLKSNFFKEYPDNLDQFAYYPLFGYFLGNLYVQWRLVRLSVSISLIATGLLYIFKFNSWYLVIVYIICFLYGYGFCGSVFDRTVMTLLFKRFEYIYLIISLIVYFILDVITGINSYTYSAQYMDLPKLMTLTYSISGSFIFVLALWCTFSFDALQVSLRLKKFFILGLGVWCSYIIFLNIYAYGSQLVDGVPWIHSVTICVVHACFDSSFVRVELMFTFAVFCFKFLIRMLLFPRNTLILRATLSYCENI